MEKITKERKAVGAIIKKDGEILMIRKVMMMDGKGGPEACDPIYSFPMGGMKPGETADDAIWRELREETGSEQYQIVRQLPDFYFDYSPEASAKLGFVGQRTTMFLVEYLGDGSDVGPQDVEIDEVKFHPAETAVEIATFDNVKEYLRDHA